MAQGVIDSPANQQAMANRERAGEPLPWEGREPAPVPARTSNGSHVACVNYSGVPRTCVASATHRGEPRKGEPHGIALTPEMTRALRQRNVQYSEMFKLNRMGDRYGLRGGRVSMSHRTVCKDCVKASASPLQHALIGTGGANQQCMVCRKIVSKVMGMVDDRRRVCCLRPVTHEKDGVEAFVRAILEPVKRMLQFEFGYSMEYSYNQGPQFDGKSVDVPITVRDRSGRIAVQIALELDANEHAGYAKEKEHSRVKDILEVYRAGAPKRGVIHFSTIGKFEVDAVSRKMEVDDALSRWLIAQSWVIDAVVNHARYPEAWALYLFYSDQNPLIVWPLRGGVCGNAYMAPKDDLSVGEHPTAPDWGSTLDASILAQSYNHYKPEETKHFSVGSLVVRRDVFGPAFGPAAKCALADRVKIYGPQRR